MASWYQILVSLLLSTLLQQVSPLYNRISTWERRCFIEDVPDNTMITCKFSVFICSFSNRLPKFLLNFLALLLLLRALGNVNQDNTQISGQCTCLTTEQTSMTRTPLKMLNFISSSPRRNPQQTLDTTLSDVNRYVTLKPDKLLGTSTKFLHQDVCYRSCPQKSRTHVFTGAKEW